MTLTRQLVVLILALMAFVFLGSYLITLNNTRTYLETQLESHAQDAATSLGLSITSHMSNNDLASVTSMVDAIFDRGFYSLVLVEDNEGKALVERKLPQTVDDVPSWFTGLISLTPPGGQAFVMSGWQQAGQVKVSSHPGFAYFQLWTSAVDTFWLFLISTIFLGGMGLGLLKMLLKPLQTVKWQADSICNREFPLVEKLPTTPDLRTIIIAMNRMTTRVKTMLGELEKLAERFRKQAMQNPVTGLGNRRFFMDILGHRIDSRDEFQQGALFLIQLREFKAYNDRYGYPAGDALLRETAEILQKITADNPKNTLSHFSGADFAVLSEDISLAETEGLAVKIAERLAKITGEDGADMSDIGHVGVAYFSGDQSSSDFLSSADMALRKAQSQGANAWHLQGVEEPQKVLSGGEWKTFIETTLAEQQVVLRFQPVKACVGDGEMHREVFVRMRDESGDSPDGLLVAGNFMPMVERFGMTVELDKVVITKSMEYLDAHPDAGLLAVNVSSQSIHSLPFVRWLEEALRASPASNRIIFEIPEYGAVSMLDELKDLIERLSVYGTRFSLDHFGRGFSPFTYLHALKVDYLKLDGSFVRQLEDQDHEYYIRSLTEIAHGLDIQVIAESVESEEAWNRLAGLNLDGAQGYFLGRPE